MSNEEFFTPPIVESPNTGGGHGEPYDARKVLEDLQKRREEQLVFELVVLPKFKLDTALQEAGILQEPIDPNPHDIEEEEELYDSWWGEHPVESDQSHAAWERKKNSEKLLYLGSKLNEVSGGKMYQRWLSMPSSFTSESLAQYLKGEHEAGIMVPSLLEGRLKKEGLLALFEEMKIIPPVDFRPKREEGELTRQEALGYLHTGALINILVKEIKAKRIELK